MPPSLTRITTVYSNREDRIRLAGEVADSQPVVIWLTRRLLERTLPVLLGWLEGKGGAKEPGAALLQSFAQEAARVETPRQDPVVAAPTSVAWLATAVDVAKSTKAVTVTFRGDDADLSARVSMNAQALRQWLAIVYVAYARADWPVTVWPDWVRHSNGPLRHEGAVVH